MTTYPKSQVEPSLERRGAGFPLQRPSLLPRLLALIPLLLAVGALAVAATSGSWWLRMVAIYAFAVLMLVFGFAFVYWRRRGEVIQPADPSAVDGEEA